MLYVVIEHFRGGDPLPVTRGRSATGAFRLTLD